MELYPISGRILQSSLVTNRLSEKADKTSANVLASQERWRVSSQSGLFQEYLVKSSIRKKFVFARHGVYGIDLISIGSLVAPGSLSKGTEGWILHLTSTSAIRKVADRAYLQAKTHEAAWKSKDEQSKSSRYRTFAKIFEYAANLSSPQLSLLREAIHIDIEKMASILSRKFQKGQDILTLYLVTGYRICVDAGLETLWRRAPIYRQLIPRGGVESNGSLEKATIIALQACRIDINHDLTVENISAPKWYVFWEPKGGFDERWPLDDKKIPPPVRAPISVLKPSLGNRQANSLLVTSPMSQQAYLGVPRVS